MSLCLRNQEFQKCQSAVLKLVILKYFENIGLSPNICKLQKEHGGDDF